MQLRDGIAVEVLAENGNFAGLGRITVDGWPLRSGARPILPEIRSPDAVHFPLLHLEHVEKLPDGGVRLHVGMSRQEGGAMEWMVHTVRQRYRRSDWSQTPQRAHDTSLIWEIRPVRRQIAGETAVGFAYQYFYHSATVPIYKILDRATWEPGGHAAGNEFWLRNAFSSPITRFQSVDEAYSTEWYLPSATNPNVFEFLPFQTQMSGFTMTAHPSGTLVTWVPEVAHVRSLFEKPRGCDQIVHLHELCGDLSLDYTSAPVEVLWLAGDRDRVGRINLYEAVRVMVSETLHAQVGMRVERASSYGVIEEWGNPDLRRYAEKGMPKLAEAGARTVFLCNQFENNMNAFGVSNMCCTTDLRVAESVGEENLAYFCAKAAEANIAVEMWGNTSLSTLGWMAHSRNGKPDRLRFPEGVITVFDELSKSADPWVRNPSNAIEADHYTPVFVAMNLRDESVRRIWLERWRDAHDRLGLGGIFLDSSFNLSSDKFHWVAQQNASRHGGTSDQTSLLGNVRPKDEPASAILSQYLAHLTLMAEMQKLGYIYCGEDIGVFGIHRAGAATGFLLGGLALWVDCLPDFEPVEIAALGENPDDVFFRGLAYRVVWKLQWNPALDQLTWIIGKAHDPTYTPKPDQLAALRGYAQVSTHMVQRYVLPDERGVVYHGNGKTVLWSFGPFPASLTGGPTCVTDVLAGHSFEAGEFRAARRGIYLIENTCDVKL